MRNRFMQSVAVSMVIVGGLIAAGTASAQTATAQDGAALAQKSGCFNCHDIDKKKEGPPLKEAAAKYKGKSNAEAAAAMKASKAHASVTASDQDMQAMNAWMQSGFIRAAGM